MAFGMVPEVLSLARQDESGLHWVRCQHCGGEVLVTQALPPRPLANLLARHWFVVHCDTEPVPVCVNHGLSFLRANLESLIALKGHVVRFAGFTLHEEVQHRRSTRAGMAP